MSLCDECGRNPPSIIPIELVIDRVHYRFCSMTCAWLFLDSLMGVYERRLAWQKEREHYN